MSKIETNLMHVVLLLNRLSLGLLFVLAGVRKLIPTEDATIWQRMKGFAGYVASEAPLPEALGKAYGFALPWGEIVFGAMLMIGLFTRFAALCVALMLVSFIVATGPAWWPDEGPAYSKNFILLTLALLMVVAGSGKLAIRADGPIK